MSTRLRTILACSATFLVATVLVLLAPMRHVSGDVVPGRLGAAVLACGGGFDLRAVDWIARRDADGEHLYWAQRGTDGDVVSIFGPGPAVAGALAMIDLGEGDVVSDAWLRWRERLAAAVLLGISGGLLTLAARRRRGPVASVGIGLVAVASFAGAATLGQALWQQAVALPCLMGALVTLVWAEPCKRLAVFAPALLLAAALLRPAVLPLAFVLGVAWMLEARAPRTWGWAAGVAVLVALPLVIWNLHYLGTPLPMGQMHANARLGDTVVLSREHLGYALGGLLVSPGRGVLWFAPIVVLGVVAALRVRARPERVVAVAILVQVCTMATFYRWWGGIGYGPRLLAEVTWVGVWLALASQATVTTRLVRGLLVAAVLVTVIVGQLGLWGWRAEQWETRRNPDIDQNALWDFVDNPIVRTLSRFDDQPIAVDEVELPPRVRCLAGRLVAAP